MNNYVCLLSRYVFTSTCVKLHCRVLASGSSTIANCEQWVRAIASGSHDNGILDIFPTQGHPSFFHSVLLLFALTTIDSLYKKAEITHSKSRYIHQKMCSETQYNAVSIILRTRTYKESHGAEVSNMYYPGKTHTTRQGQRKHLVTIWQLHVDAIPRMRRLHWKLLNSTQSFMLFMTNSAIG